MTATGKTKKNTSCLEDSSLLGEDLNLHPHCCENLKFHEEFYHVNDSHLKIVVNETPIIYIILNIPQTVMSKIIVIEIHLLIQAFTESYRNYVLFHLNGSL
jgi:hypothetical protein